MKRLTGSGPTKNMAEQGASLSDSLTTGKGETIKLYHYFIHLGYYIPYWVKFFFSKPFKKETKELKLLDQVQMLIESNDTAENISKCKELIRLHRIVENTKARRRLEKWSLRVIAIYLFVVLAIVVSCYTHWDGKPIFWKVSSSIPCNIMIAILTTTTANIIGLGLIVLRGHFLAKEDMSENHDNILEKGKEEGTENV